MLSNEYFLLPFTNRVEIETRNLSRPPGATGWYHYSPKLKAGNDSPGGPVPCPDSHSVLSSKNKTLKAVIKPLYGLKLPRNGEKFTPEGPFFNFQILLPWQRIFTNN